MRVLIADDDPVYQALLEDLMAQWGHQIVLARDGAEAWEALQAPEPPNLALLDWMMPGMDGFELCRRIRDERPNGDQIYVILITGSSGGKDIIKVMVAGADDYLIKPFDPSELKVRLRAGMRILDLRAEIAQLKRITAEHVGAAR